MTNDSFASKSVVNATSGLTYEFQNRPRYEPLEAYQKARETFLRRIQGVPGIAAVYESGADGPSVPGISDIDLIVIVEDDVSDTEAVRDEISAAKVDEYYFFHGPEVLTRSTFSEYYNVLPMPKELVHLHGAELSYERNRDEYNYLAYLVDQVNTTYPMEFLDFLFFPGVSLSSRQFNILVNDMIDLAVPKRMADRLPVRLDTRLAIHRLNSLRNDFNLFLEATERDSAVLEQFDESITALRQEWFELSKSKQNERLLSRLRDSVTACFAFVDDLEDHLSDCGIEVQQRVTEYRTSDVYPNEYSGDWNRNDAERKTVTNYRHRRVKSCVLPQAVTVNERLRSNETDVRAPDLYVETLESRDRTKRRRDESMAMYKYHPFRSQYMSVLEYLHRVKTRTVT